MSNMTNFIPEMPCDIEAEERILGFLLTRKGKAKEIIGLSPDHFYAAIHGMIYRAITHLLVNNLEISTSNVKLWLSDRGYLEMVGGYDKIINLAGAVVYSQGDELFSSVEYATKIVIECHQRRKIIEGLQKTYDLVRDRSLPLEDSIASIDQNLLSMTQLDSDSKPTGVTFEQAIVKRFERLFDTEDKDAPIPTSIKALDEYVRGFSKQTLWVIAGESGSGKSALLLQMAWDAAINGVPTLVFSLEMSEDDCATRWMSRAVDIAQVDIANKNLDEQRYSDLTSFVVDVAPRASKTLIDDSETVTLATISGAIRRFKAQHGDIGLVAIDHIQLLDSAVQGFQRHLELDKQARELKRMAKLHNCTIIALSQINRSTTSSADKRPSLASIRDSSAIATHADIVLGLYRDELHNPNTTAKCVAELILLKNRNGALGTVKTLFEGRNSDFREAQNYGL